MAANPPVSIIGIPQSLIDTFNSSGNAEQIYPGANFDFGLLYRSGDPTNPDQGLILSITIHAGWQFAPGFSLGIGPYAWTLDANALGFTPNAGTLSQLFALGGSAAALPDNFAVIVINGIEFFFNGGTATWFSSQGIATLVAPTGAAPPPVTPPATPPPGGGAGGGTPVTAAQLANLIAGVKADISQFEQLGVTQVSQAVTAAQATLDASIKNGLSLATAAIQNAVNNAGAPVIAAVNQAASATQAAVNSVSGPIVAAVQATVTPIQNAVNALQAPIVGAVNGVTTGVTSALATAQDAITGGIQSSITAANSASQAVQNAVTTAAGSAASSANALANDITQGTQTLAAGVAQGAKDIVAGVAADVAAGVQTTVNAANATGNAIVGAVQAAATQAASSASSLADSLTPALNSLLAGLQGLPQALLAGAGTLVDKLLAGLDAPIKKAMSEILNNLLGLNVDDPSDPIAAVAISPGHVDPNDPILGPFKAAIDKMNPFSKLIAYLIILPTMYVHYISQLIDVDAEPVRQDINKKVLATLPSVGDLMESLFRDNLSGPKVDDYLARHGFNLDLRAAFIDNARAIPTVVDLAAALNRGFIDEAAFRKALGDLHFTQANADMFFSLKDVLPPISDLIYMMRRDVFIPEIVAKFGQDLEFPQDQVPFFEQNGLTPEWQHRYWQAHWDLPSPQQGFEMYQRGVIDIDTLNRLLRAAGYEPFWRDKLVSIAYVPVNRIDIRRFNKLGFFDHPEMVKRYQAIGFSPADAELEAQFTEKLNGLGAKDFAGQLAQLAVHIITQLFENAIITRDQAKAALIDKGEPPAIAEAYLELVDIQISIRKRKADAELIVAQEAGRVITYQQAVNKLNELVLSAPEFEGYLAQIVKNQTTRLQVIPKTDLDNFLKSGVIDEARYRAGMEALGFPDVDIDVYIKFLTGK